MIQQSRGLCVKTTSIYHYKHVLKKYLHIEFNYAVETIMIFSESIKKLHNILGPHDKNTLLLVSSVQSNGHFNDATML